MEEQIIKRGGFGNPFSVLTDKLNIRGKLMLAFLVMIVLTLAVIVIATISQRFATKTIDELVQVHGKVARLSLDTEKTLKVMNVYEKDFLLNYNKIGKSQYLNRFIAAGGEAYQKLYEIQLITPDAEKAAVQKAMDVINNYIATFMSTVNILERMVNPEFGELTKLRQAMDVLRKSVSAVNSVKIQALFQNLL
jgi:twitching motility protein PilJ